MPSGRFATIVLVAALFFCHGVYGFEHQLVELGPGTATEMVHSTHSDPMGTHHAPSGGGDSGHGNMPNGEYFAVMIPMLLALVLWPLRRCFRIPEAREAQRLATQTVAPLVSHRPRGPKLYLFQVMRL